MSGAKTAGREFGLGIYDGITGIVTQPWKGAQKEGLGGFAKGFDKGIGGLVAKPSAAAFGILGYTMKWIHKEVQNMSGSSVQSYIAASRLAQREEEWLRGSDAEKREVIAGWKVLQKYLKKKHSPEEMLRDVLDGQRKANAHAAAGRERSGSGGIDHFASVCPGPDRDMVVVDGSHPIVVEQAVEVAELEAVESPRQGKCVEWERVLHLNADEEEVFKQSVSDSRGTLEDVSNWQHYDSGHLAGTSRGASELEAWEETKSRQEKTEEEIVLEYIEKQSLVEELHQSNGKSRVAALLDQEDEDLRRASELSMQVDDCT
jgi:hypothetical protein